jgi:signal transduction histidine kinase
VLGKEDQINLTIEDDGKGFDPNKVSDRGLGLIGMEERIKKLGGTFSIVSQTQKDLKGTVINVELPYMTEVLT